MPIRVVLVGLGPIGAAVAGQLERRRKAFQIVGAVDIDPSKIGRDAGEVLELGRRMRVKVTDSIGKTTRATKPDVAVLCTGSALKQVLPQFEEVLKQRVPIVTTTEQAAYTVRRSAPLAKRLDQAARRAKCAVLGTGVNPGFVMDALPIALTAVCERVDRIEVQRIQDARIRRLPFQRKIGAGLTPEQFRQATDRNFVEKGFYEAEIGSNIERFGNVASVRSVYETRRTAEGPLLGRGINYLTLFWDGKRWWIANAVWDDERPDNPIPKEWIRPKP